ncbi:MAG: hypothetical protein JXX28_14340, partial [Deltaproteobacteria bacterium]|nr:hypothetical protein [Deltaproteobacteria bacterium]
MSWLLISALAVHAQTTYSVSCSSSPCADALQGALIDAVAGDTVAVGPGTYLSSVAAPLVVPDGVRLVSTQGASRTVLRSADALGATVQVLYGYQGAEIRGFTILPGLHAVKLPENARLTLAEVQVLGDGVSTGVSGQGVSVGHYGQLLVRDSVFRDLAGVHGAAIGVAADSESYGPGSLVLENVEFSDCVATGRGGAVAGLLTVLEAEGCHFSGNRASGGGGAVDVWGNAAIFLRDSSFQDNRAGGSGGHLRAPYRMDYSRGQSLVQGCSFVGGVAGEDGGALHLTGADLRLAYNTFEDNRAGGSGGALWVEGDATVGGTALSQCAFVGNDAGQEGGAVYLTTVKELELLDNRFEENVAGEGAAALLIGNVYTAASRNLFCDNTVDPARSSGPWGTAVDYLTSGHSRWDNNLFLRGRGPYAGLGLEADGAPLVVANNAMLGNEGTGVYLGDGYHEVYNNLVAWTQGYGAEAGSDATVHAGYNAWFENDPGHYTGFASEGNDLLSVDPGLELPVEVMPCAWPGLLGASPLLDAGSDQGGPDRDGSRSDIGLSGGPHAAVALAGDGDGDGVIGALDCDDQDPGVYPGAPDNWYDGVDSDCDGANDFDADRDGHESDVFGGDDCVDYLAGVHPGAPEVWYNDLDDACDGGSDYDADGDGEDAVTYGGTDCDDADPAVSTHGAEVWYDGRDGDCDGGSDYDADGDGADAAAYGGLDCDDGDGAVHPGAPEVWYDGRDGNCDGADDFDRDGDGHHPSLFGGGDCDDGDGAVHPGAPEVWYDGVDSDCGGGSDYDADGDGFKAEAHGGNDCDDRDAGVHPGAADAWYDGVDSDCAGDDDSDQDRDGYRGGEGGEDCDDLDPLVHPGAADAPYDGRDDDCAGDDDFDRDGDGYHAASAGGGDCDDTDPTVHPGAVEDWSDAVDQDCDGVIALDLDRDGDGYEPGDGDCDDEDAGVHPGAADAWYDGVDSNCDGADDSDQDGDG